MRLRSNFRPPGYRTAQLVAVPLLAGLLAIGSACGPDEKESAWNSPRTSTFTETQPTPAKKLVETTPRTSSVPSATAAIAGSSATTAPVKTDTAAGSTGSDQGNSPRRSDIVTESIQLTPCQQSAAACFASGGLDTLTENLDGLAIDPVTGRFCFSFQEGCRR